MGLFSKAKKLLLGKKQDPFGPTKMMELDPSLKKSVEMGRQAQQKGLEGLLALDSRNIPQIQRAQMARELKGVESSGADAARKIRDTMAQRGMGRSSVGIGLEKGVEENTARQKASIMAQLAERIRNMRETQAMRQISGAGMALGSPGAQRALLRGQDKGRKGGLLKPLLTMGGAVAGGSMGGPQGASKGAQAGSSLGTSFENM